MPLIFVWIVRYCKEYNKIFQKESQAWWETHRLTLSAEKWATDPLPSHPPLIYVVKEEDKPKQYERLI